jgi:hypothetical protein
MELGLATCMAPNGFGLAEFEGVWKLRGQHGQVASLLVQNLSKSKDEPSLVQWERF